jgi:hypothetical protein
MASSPFPAEDGTHRTLTFLQQLRELNFRLIDGG